MHADGVDALRRRLSVMLQGECVDGLTMRNGVCGTRVLSSQHFPIDRPASWRGLHITMSWPCHRWDHSAAADARHELARMDYL
jgi:hypothetical protein